MTVPPTSPPPGWPSAAPPPPPPPGRPERPARPVDVDTGFWLWLAALPVLTTGYLVNTVASLPMARTGTLYAGVGLTAALVGALVVTLLILMRSGYRWARTVLTGGGVAAVVYAVTGVFDADQSPVVAVTSAVTGIIGSVLVAGGTFLLHRSDAQDYFTR